MRKLTVMLIMLLLVAGLSACTTKSKEPRAKVLCPACGTEFEALFQKSF